MSKPTEIWNPIPPLEHKSPWIFPFMSSDLMNLIIAKLNALCNLTVNGKGKIIKADGNVVIDLEDQVQDPNALTLEPLPWCLDVGGVKTQVWVTVPVGGFYHDNNGSPDYGNPYASNPFI